VSINHREEAELLLSKLDTTMAAALEKDLPIEDQQHAAVLTGILTNRALAHASLAAGEATVADASSYRHTITTMRFALIRHVAEGRALSETDEAYQHACGLATHLDAVGLNVDDAVDAYIQDHLGMEPRDMDLCPTERRAKWIADCASMPTPWDTDGLPS
jgi:hypothetical protein